MKNRILAVLLTLTLAISLAACNSGEASATPASGSAQPTTSLTPEAAPTGTKPTADRAGNPIEVPETVNTIVSMTPSTTQVILDLGLADKLVGIDVDSAWMFPEVAEITAFDTYNPDLEQLMLLNADILFSAELNTGGEGSPFTPLVDAGHCVADIPAANSLAEIYEDIRFIAACLGAEEGAEALIAGTQAVADEIAALAANVEERKTVSIEIAALPTLYVAGDGVFLNEILQLMGAENPYAGSKGWLPLTEEAAVEANPDIILTTVNYMDDPVGEILAREGWGVVTAVANGDVYYIDNAAASLPNHNVKLAMVEIAKIVYPEVYEGL